MDIYEFEIETKENIKKFQNKKKILNKLLQFLEIPL